MDFNKDIEKYIDINKYEGLSYFTAMSPKKMEDKDLKLLRPLTEKYSSYLWGKYVSKQNRHPMPLNKGEWVCYLKQEEYNWQKDWNEGSYDGLKEYLIRRVSFKSSDVVYFFWMKERGIETIWECFLKYWISFLYDDEGPILLSPDTNEVVSFGPTGSLHIGKRKIID